MRVVIQVITDESLEGLSDYKIQAWLRQLKLLSANTADGRTMYIDAKVESDYARCRKCDKIFRAVKGGGPVRHPCV